MGNGEAWRRVLPGLHLGRGLERAGEPPHRVPRCASCPWLASSHFALSLASNVLRLSTIMLQLDGADWPFSRPPTHYLKLGIVAQIVLRGIEAVHPVQCDASRRAPLSGHLRKMHRIRPRSRCIPRFHLPLQGCPWRLVVSEGHLDHRWGSLVSTGHLRVGLPKRFGSGSGASVGGTAQARWRIARMGG